MSANHTVDLAAVLRSRGMRMTPQRQLVLDAIADLGHATPEHIHDSVAERVEGINITTIYRTLDLLEELNLVTHTHLSHGAPTYHLAGDRGHAHLVCHRCGKTEEVSPAVFSSARDAIASDSGFVLDIGHVALFGTCAQCLDKKDGTHG
ncbi:Fur family transcriptional regulator [Haloglycomyces albus]|uniref:Fur family transcriptional regulator n=1 Tax=Haloglycomyces albus TaxID=526067 RepID=UPI00046D0A25|nr:Fur family transcriptional regulator [Haloglycomyces albus]